MIENFINELHNFALDHQTMISAMLLLLILTLYFLLIILMSFIFGKLKGENWQDIERELSARSQSMQLALRNAQSLGVKNPIELSIIDVTISKAQARLSRRAFWFMIIGLICWMFALSSAWKSLEFLKTNDIPNFLSTLKPVYGSKGINIIDGYTLSMWVIRGATLGAAYLSTILIPGWLGIAFFHEATTLYNRRHAVRFGRLYLYLKCANAQDVSAIDLGDLDKLVGWNIQTPSAFRDIDFLKLPKNGYSPELLAQIIDSIAKSLEKKNSSSDK